MGLGTSTVQPDILKTVVPIATAGKLHAIKAEAASSLVQLQSREAEDDFLTVLETDTWDPESVREFLGALRKVANNMELDAKISQQFCAQYYNVARGAVREMERPGSSGETLKA